jgi:hypothetical protein
MRYHHIPTITGIALIVASVLSGYLVFHHLPVQAQESEETNAAEEDEQTENTEGSDEENDSTEESDPADEGEETSDQQDSEDSEDGIDDKEIEQIKETVASTVEELTQSTYGTAGFIQTVEDGVIRLNTRDDDIEVIIDEDITEIYALEDGALKDRDEDDLEITDYITVIGPELEGTLNANTIILDTAYTVRSGKIVEVNEDDFYISVLTLDRTTYTLDVEKNTTTELYNIQSQELEQIGFSKLKEGDTVHFTGPTGWRDDQDRFSVTSLLVIPQEYFLK